MSTVPPYLLTAAIALAPLLLATQPALAASRQSKERAARTACLAGDAAKGVEILAELFVETREPTYIFNQGRCFEQNGRYTDAVSRFEEYLRTADSLSADDKAAAQKHIADCEKKEAKARGDAPLQPPPPSVVVPPPPAPTVPEPVTPVAAVPAVAPPPPQHPRWGLLTAGIVTGAVGVGGIITGVVFNMKANSTIDEMETQLDAYSTNKSNDQKTYKTLAWVGYGAGAACAVAGAVLIAVGSRPKATPRNQVALVPSVGAGHVGAVLTGGF